MRRREISAGILAFRRKPTLEVLLAHPGGPFWAKKDDGVWTIPKGLIAPGEDLADEIDQCGGCPAGLQADPDGVTGIRVQLKGDWWLTP